MAPFSICAEDWNSRLDALIEFYRGELDTPANLIQISSIFHIMRFTYACSLAMFQAFKEATERGSQSKSGTVPLAMIESPFWGCIREEKPHHSSNVSSPSKVAAGSRLADVCLSRGA